MNYEVDAQSCSDDPTDQQESRGKPEKPLQSIACGVTFLIVMTLGFVGGLWWQQADGQQASRSKKKPMGFMDYVLWVSGSDETWDEIEARQERWHHDFVTEMEWQQKDFMGNLQRDQRKLQRAIHSQYQLKK